MCDKRLVFNLKVLIFSFFCSDIQMTDLFKDYLFTLLDIIAQQKWIPSEIKTEIEGEVSSQVEIRFIYESSFTLYFF